MLALFGASVVLTKVSPALTRALNNFQRRRRRAQLLEDVRDSSRPQLASPADDSGIGTSRPSVAYRDDRDALRERIRELEAELERTRKAQGVDELRAELDAAKAVISAMLRVKVVSLGAQTEGRPHFVTWHFCIQNVGSGAVRLVGGRTNWCLEQPGSDDPMLLRLLAVPEENDFSDRPVLQPGGTSDTYRVKLDTRSEAARAGLKSQGMVLGKVKDLIQPLVQVDFEGIDIEHSGSAERLLEWESPVA